MPPVPPPPPPLSNPNSKSMDLPNTAALLKSIERGTKLKKTVTHDRSAPIVSSQPNSCAPNKSASSQNLNSNNASSLGGLFANGFPALRSTKSSGNNNQISFIKKPVEHAIIFPKEMEKNQENLNLVLAFLKMIFKLL